MSRQLSTWCSAALGGFFAVALTARSALAAPAASAAAPGPSAHAATPPANTAAPKPTVASPPKGKAASTCTEYLGEHKERPKVVEAFPKRGKSGYVAALELVVEHGKGETVFPGGLSVHVSGDESRAIGQAGFWLPDPGGGARPLIEVKPSGDRATTTVRIPFVPLPKDPGRQELVLPPVPVAIARASGAVITLCTEPHAIVVEDPIANTPDAKPKRNPKPRRQLEEWTAAKHAAIGGAIAIAIALLAWWLLRQWMKRPRKVPAPPPPRPPWEVALEELFDVRNAGLIAQQRYLAHFVRVSHTVRRYLGERYGFDGLESTTREMFDALDEIDPPIVVMSEIRAFLDKADLVKFAKVVPTEAECEHAIDRGETIVRRTTPTSFHAEPTEESPARPPSDQRGATP